LTYLFFRAWWTAITNKIDVIYLGDGLLAPLGLCLKILARKPVAVTIHGRDIGFKNRVYQYIVPRCLNKLDKVICVSNALMKACQARGIDGKRLTVIENGISDRYHTDADKKILRKQISKMTGNDITNRIIILSVGRLVEKKGIHWFVDKVMPSLSDIDCAYLIAGEGPMYQTIQNIIKEHRLEQRVFPVGWADNEKLKILYNGSDIFVMPQIPAEVAGFGLVALEAASCGLIVVTSNLGGIADAIIDGKNGYLCKPGDQESYTNTIRTQLKKSREEREAFAGQARAYTLANYDWGRIAGKYITTFKSLATS
jgi:glycosyltransferase involved in cell wall biosynthesis